MVIEIKDQLDEAHFGSCTTFTCKLIAFDFGVRVITIFFQEKFGYNLGINFFRWQKRQTNCFSHYSAYNHCSRCVTNVA